MRPQSAGWQRTLSNIGCTIVAALCFSGACSAQVAQANGVERSFPQSKTTVEQGLKAMQNATAGRLPVLDGFANGADHPLDRYQRGYYQSKIQVSSAPSGGSIVRVSVQVTAWYNDPTAAHSGYQVLPSNGRLESDLLDQLADQLASRTAQAVVPPTPAAEPSPAPAIAVTKTPAPGPTVVAAAPIASPPPVQPTESTGPSLSAPLPRIPESASGISSSLAETLNQQEKSGSESEKKTLKDQNKLQAEADSLEEIIKNQAHPNNLVAVKKSGTPVVATPSLTARTLFLASAHDEFEMLNFNQDWVHVKISGLSRGWIWRNNLELPDSVPDSDLAPNATGGPVAGDLFHVTREEEAVFPGDWAPLRGKTVKIISVEKVSEDDKNDAGPKLRLEFAKSVLDKTYGELAQNSQGVSGIVLIFDSADGGMIAATLPTLQQWKAGTLSDAALWHQCFFDPPESFTATDALPGQ